MKLRYLLHLEHRGDSQLGRGQAEVVVNEDEDDDGDDDGVVSDQGPDLDGELHSVTTAYCHYLSPSLGSRGST